MSSLKEIKKEINNELKSYRSNRDSAGRCVINLTIYDDDNFLSPYSLDNEEIISDEMSNFFDHATKAVAPKDSLHINIYSDKIDEEEKKIYPKAIKNYYYNQLLEIRRNLITNAIVSAMLAIVGVGIVIALFSISAIRNSYIIAELVTIFGWVFCWEAVDQFFIQRRILNRQRLRYINLMNAKITFKPLISNSRQINKHTK